MPFFNFVISIMVLCLWADANQADFNTFEWRTLRPQFETKYNTPLHVVILDQKKWPKDEVLKRLRRTQEIYSQCEISFKPLKLLSLNRPDLSSFDYSNKEDVALLEKLKIDRRPLLIFANKNTSAFGFDAYTWIDSSDTAEIRKRVSFVFDSWKRTERYLRLFDGITRYSVVAHELGHTLLNLSDHSDLPRNVMGKKTSPMGDVFTNDQCLKMQKFSKTL